MFYIVVVILTVYIDKEQQKRKYSRQREREYVVTIYHIRLKRLNLCSLRQGGKNLFSWFFIFFFLYIIDLKIIARFNSIQFYYFKDMQRPRLAYIYIYF